MDRQGTGDRGQGTGRTTQAIYDKYVFTDEANIAAFREKLGTAYRGLPDEALCTDVEHEWRTYLASAVQILRRIAPPPSLRHKSPWITERTLALIHKKTRVH